MANKRRFSAEKLLREKVPALMQEKGIFFKTRLVSGEELARQLEEKIAEEVLETIVATAKEKKISELADTLEAIASLAHALGSSMQEVETVRQKKRAEQGGYEKGIYAEYAEMDENNAHIKHYLNNPDRYPEMPVTPEK